MPESTVFTLSTSALLQTTDSGMSMNEALWRETTKALYSEDTTEYLLNATTALALQKSSSKLTAEEIENCELYQFLMSFILLFCIVLLGSFGNLLSIVVLWPDRSKSATNFLLLVLAFVDNGVLVTRFLMLGLPALCTYIDRCSAFMEFYKVWFSAFGWATAGLFHLATSWITVQVSSFLEGSWQK